MGSSPVLARLRQLEARLLPHGILDVVRQVALFAAAYWGYRLVRGAADGKAADAFQNGRDLISLERGMHSFVEPSIQAWTSGQAWLIDFASWMYVNSHFSITLGALVFIYLFHNSSFYFIRNMFMVAMALALVGYVVYPTAPPRFFPEYGFTDSVVEFVGQSASQSAGALYNPYAAIPSMHIAFALMIAIPATQLVKWRPLKIFWGIYPLIVCFVVVATGNHFWIDAVLGAATAGAAAWLATNALGRARPGAWAWRGATA